MLFPTIEYAVLFAVAFGLAWSTRKLPTVHKSCLLALSWLFYAWGSPEHLPLLIGIGLTATACARAVQRASSPKVAKRWVSLGCALPLLVLVVFKYLDFAIGSVADLAAVLGFELSLVPPGVVLPIGVSFFAFHAISLVVDVYRGNVRLPVRWLDGSLYLAFFPQLVAGPVVRASDLLPQFDCPPNPAAIERDRALLLLVGGLFKKVVLASHLGTLIADPVFEAPSDFDGGRILLGVYAYAGQIYCDFSGYTDMAIGSALLLGYRFKANFDAPYAATSIQDFWHRWHISLSTFLRDYLFIPLGGSRGGEAATRRNLLWTMLLGGLWHGAAWTFVVWGAMHGVALVVHRAWSRAESPLVQRIRAHVAWRPVAWLLTLHTVCLGWVFFRATSFDDAFAILSGLTRPGPGVPIAAVLLVAVATLSQLLPWSGWSSQLEQKLARWPSPLVGVVMAVMVVAVDALGPIGVPPFIYFQF